MEINIQKIIEMLLIPVICFAVLWGVFTTKIKANEEDIQNLTQNYKVLLEIKSDISAIKTDVTWIKQELK